MKTPSELGLTDDQYRGLMMVLAELEGGRLPYYSRTPRAEAPTGRHFNMSLWMNACGTIGCIGGWAEELSGCHYDFEDNPPLDRLFFPQGVSLRRVGPEQAAQAVRSYLETGEPRWGE